MFERIKHLKIFIKDPDKKNWIRIIFECLHFGIIKKELPIDYFRKYLYRKDIKNYKDYLSLKQYFKIIHSPKIKLHDIAPILNNKLSFALFAKEHNLPVPKLISYNLRNTFYLDSTSYYIYNKKDLIDFFKTCFETSKTESLFLKPLNSQGGAGCILLKKENLEDTLTIHFKSILSNSYLNQVVIQQHQVVSKINAHSVNTIRIVTFVDENHTSEIISALMRFGIGDSFVDNAGGGGFYVSVDLETGKLHGVGRQDVSKGGNVFKKHPNTGVVLEGYTIPYFKEVCELVLKVSLLLPTKLVGWDIAITPEGPVIVEGNEGPSLHMSGVAYGGYLKHPIIKELMKKV